MWLRAVLHSNLHKQCLGFFVLHCCSHQVTMSSQSPAAGGEKLFKLCCNTQILYEQDTRRWLRLSKPPGHNMHKPD
ncbi:unnamed protein product [Linum trigynum]|uniref:Secreted protein n=1 Tax=Linum trigynum TaxID=586398 RepID=A0AAV2GTW8_9ROSI